MKKSIKILLIVLAVIAVVAVLGIILFSMGIIGSGTVMNDYAQDLAESQTGAMDSMMVDMFNSQFLSYCGDNIKAATVKSLIAKAGDSKVEVAGITTVEEINASAKYTVKESYGKDGMINKITITEN